MISKENWLSLSFQIPTQEPQDYEKVGYAFSTTSLSYVCQKITVILNSINNNSYSYSAKFEGVPSYKSNTNIDFLTQYNTTETKSFPFISIGTDTIDFVTQIPLKGFSTTSYTPHNYEQIGYTVSVSNNFPYNAHYSDSSSSYEMYTGRISFDYNIDVENVRLTEVQTQYNSITYCYEAVLNVDINNYVYVGNPNPRLCYYYMVFSYKTIDGRSGSYTITRSSDNNPPQFPTSFSFISSIPVTSLDNVVLTHP